MWEADAARAGRGMLPILLYLIYVLVLMVCVGSIIEHILEKLGIWPRVEHGAGTQFGDLIDLVILGWAGLSALAMALALVLPLSTTVQVVVSGLAFLAGWSFAPRHALTWPMGMRGYLVWAVLSSVVCLLGAAYFASGHVVWLDTGIYHAQSLRWVKEFGSVPGLGNLLPQLGFNSAWHALWGFFDHGLFDAGRTYHVAGLVPVALLLALWLDGSLRVAYGGASVAGLLRVCGPIALLYYYCAQLPSLSPDPAAAALVLYAAVRTCDAIERGAGDRADTAVPNAMTRELGLVTVAAALALTVKQTTAAAVLLPVLVLWRMRPVRLGTLLVCAGIGLLQLSPFLVRNYMLTGYLMFPHAWLDIFGADWKVPRADVAWLSYFIREYAIGKHQDLALGQMGLWEKGTVWFESNIWTTEFVPFAVCVAIWVVAILLFPFLRENVKGRIMWVYGIQLVLFAGAVLVGWYAPDPRFLGCWLIPMTGLGVSSCLHCVAVRCYPVAKMFWLVTGAGLWLMPYLCWLMMSGPVDPRLVGAASPPPTLMHEPYGPALFKVRALPEPNLVRVKSQHGVEVYVLQVYMADRCLFYGALPAAERVHPWLQLRGESLKHGFRVTQPSGWLCYVPGHLHQKKAVAPESGSAQHSLESGPASVPALR